MEGCWGMKKIDKKFQSYDEVASCPLPCGQLVQIRYTFFEPVSKEHFIRFKKYLIESEIYMLIYGKDK